MIRKFVAEVPADLGITSTVTFEHGFETLDVCINAYTADGELVSGAAQIIDVNTIQVDAWAKELRTGRMVPVRNVVVIG